MCEKLKFQSKALMLKYYQESLNSCYLGSLDSYSDIINKTKADNYIAMRIEESLKIKVGNRIDLENYILINKKYLKVNRRCIIS